MRRVRPQWRDKLSFAGTAAIREEIARAIPVYAGIQNLKAKGDSFQYGGPMLCADQKFSTADGKAHFKAVNMPQISAPAGSFRVVTRRGKQFNSMVHEDIDASTAASRDAVMMSPLDARRLGLLSGDHVRLHNDYGTYDGTLLLAPVTAGTLEIYWPEGNVLVDPYARSPLAKIPAYKEISATVERANGAEQPEPVLKL
jgi:predicted molibdopterin-dependent oxidoreductase YjgC